MFVRQDDISKANFQIWKNKVHAYNVGFIFFDISLRNLNRIFFFRIMNSLLCILKKVSIWKKTHIAKVVSE